MVPAEKDRLTQALETLATATTSERHGHLITMRNDDGLAVAILHMPRCWSCMVGQHVGGKHPWAGEDDLDHVAPDQARILATQDCGCDCVDKPEMAYVPDMDEMVEVPAEEVALFATPCTRCGAVGACSYDNEGLPMIHSLVYNEDE